MLQSALILIGIIGLDVILSGDNAVVIAMAANGLAPQQRNAAIAVGMAGAFLLRIAACLFASTLLSNPVVGVIGGLALLWVCWNLLMDIMRPSGEEDATKPAGSFAAAIAAIAIADISMSLDNILAIAALAGQTWWLMIFGLFLSIAIMTIAAKAVSLLLERLPVLNWIGLGLILLVAVRMIWAGAEMMLA